MGTGRYGSKKGRNKLLTQSVDVEKEKEIITSRYCKKERCDKCKWFACKHKCHKVNE